MLKKDIVELFSFENFLRRETDQPVAPWCRIFINVILCNIKTFLCPNQTTDYSQMLQTQSYCKW